MTRTILRNCVSTLAMATVATGVSIGSAAAQQGTPAAQANDDDAAKGDIVVTGVRTSLAKARETKRKANTIVDIVDAEDIGKLPNNTVGDVVASIPGISVFRTEGEVNDIQLRGLNGVQTTLGGTPIESGADRVASIADLPADLVKSVEVYKTRSPDQVDGAGAGSINIELRKPVDFKDGFFFSGNATARYNNQSRRYNQVYTAITNYRRETGIGDVGAQFGFTINHNPFLESQAFNDLQAQVQTRQVIGPQILPLPTFAPSQVAFLYTTGSRTTPTVNGALQWSPDSDNTVVLEGTYAAPTFDRFTNRMFMPVTLQATGTSTNTLPALSNIVLVPGTNRMASVTVSPVTQVGPIADISESKDSNFLVKLSARHSEERFDASAELAYTGGNVDSQLFTTRNRFVNRPTYDVEFASDEFRFPMMNLNFRDLNLLDPNQYRFFGLFEQEQMRQNRTFSTRADLKLRTLGGPITRIDVGARFSDRTTQRQVFQREVTNLQINLADMPEGYRELIPIAEGFAGTGVKNNARWLSYDRFAARENFPALRQLLSTFNPAFQSEDPPEDIAQNFRSRERSVAMYGTLNYSVDPWFPIDGIIGARITNTARYLQSFSRRAARVLVNNVITNATLITPAEGRQNLLVVEPTVTAVLHFTPKFQTRLSYNVGVRLPTVDQITPFINFNDAAANGTAGNPDLQPEKTTRYDVIFEYYFGRIGTITVNPFYWKLNGGVTNFTTLETVEGGADGVLYQISRPFNAGAGYRRGVEAQVQSFFTFLPGILKNFGTVLNYTYIDSRQTFNAIPGSSTVPPGSLPIVRIPKHVFNAQALFERGTLNARVSYNYNGSVVDGYDLNVPTRFARYLTPRSWMDAAINYTIPKGPLKNIGFSLQVQNVLASARRSFYGFQDQPRDVIYMARTYGGTVRYKF